MPTASESSFTMRLPESLSVPETANEPSTDMVSETLLSMNDIESRLSEVQEKIEFMDWLDMEYPNSDPLRASNPALPELKAKFGDLLKPLPEKLDDEFDV